MNDAQTGDVVYHIDALDMITDVNDAWVEFARRNDGESLTRQAVVGSDLWTYVSGAEIRHIYGQMIGEVRAGRDVSIPFRCDSPTVRRFHQMRMTALGAGRV